MKNMRINASLLTLLLVLTVWMSLFVGQAVAAEKVFVFTRPLIGTLDPATCGDAEGAQNMSQMYDTLVILDKTGNIAPGLAESWDVSPEYKTYTFHLRKGIKFHDGTPLTAQAIKFSFDRMLRVNRSAYGNYLKYGQPDGCQVIDDHTIKVQLKEPFSIFLIDLTMGAYYIVSPEYIKSHATKDDPDALKWMTDHACGTGPFKMVELISGQRLVFEKYKEYWGQGFKIKPPAKIDKLIFEVVRDPSNARLLLEKGDVDATEKLTVEQFDKLKSSPDVKVVDFLLPKAVYLTMDVSKPPFDDINVRRAISHAINTEQIIEFIEKGHVKRMHGLIPAGLMGHNPDFPIYKFDLEKAKEYMAKSKYPNGFTTDFLLAVERRPEFEQVSEYIQAYLKKIGITVNIQKVAFDVQLPKMEKGNYGISLMNWTANMPDPEDIVGWLYDSSRSSGGWNGAHWDNKEVQGMLKKAREIGNQEERKKLYQETDKIAVDQAIYVDLYQLTEQFAVRKNVQDFYFDPQAKVYFWEVDK
ncbi:MAG: ABC transporter substrate-binding protein [Deltaproteobacteria bacterium]|nr:ABC transporter substrate-binding protein [Deltaproteobacteria bacterium]